MKELINLVPQSIDFNVKKAIASMDKDLLDRLVLTSWWFVYQIGTRHGLKPQGQRWARRFEENIRQGFKTPFAEYLRKMFAGFETQISGEEMIPENPVLYVSNHPEGPLFGTWYPFAINWAITHRFDDPNRAPRWFLRGFSDNPVLTISNKQFFILKESWGILRDRVVQKLAEATDCLLIPQDRAQFPRIFAEAGRHFEQGGQMAICFEQGAGNQLSRARPGVGLFIRIVSDNGQIPIVPVASWFEDDRFNISFGQSIDLANFLAKSNPEITDKDTSQRTIDYIAAKIASLLPEEKRGVYELLAKDK